MEVDEVQAPKLSLKERRKNALQKKGVSLLERYLTCTVKQADIGAQKDIFLKKGEDGKTFGLNVTAMPPEEDVKAPTTGGGLLT